jgi:hypothetical protein
MASTSGAHPPFAHNPHVWGGVDPDAAPEPAAVDEAAVVDEEPATDVDGDGRIDGYEAFTKAELVAECERLGLSTVGNKADLVARLQAADPAQAPA